MKICFLSLNAYPLIKQENHGYAGGAEVEQVHLGAELASQGYDVRFVTYNYGQNHIEIVNGIKIIKTYNREKADQLSFLLKYACLWYALQKADADIYVHEAGSYGVLPIFCRINRKKFIHRIASDTIVLGTPLNGDYGFVEKFSEILENKKADFVIAQSEFQSKILTERFRVKNAVIKNGIVIPKTVCEKPNPPIVLWAGSISNVKRPRLFMELAKSIPNAPFEMIGGKTSGEPQLYDEVLAIAQKLPNLKFHGFVSYHNVNDYFKRDSIFVNTSRVEGFPNTFIQAWSHKIPVVSLNVDPDKIIQNENLGFRSGTFKQLVSDVTTLLENEELRKTMGKNAREYVEKEHDIKQTVKKYIKIFEEFS